MNLMMMMIMTTATTMAKITSTKITMKKTTALKTTTTKTTSRKTTMTKTTKKNTHIMCVLIPRNFLKILAPYFGSKQITEIKLESE